MQSGVQPLGQFDILNTDASSILGGEVMTLHYTTVANSSTETSAFDAQDGYVAPSIDTGTTTQYRPLARIASTSYIGTPYYNALYLADEGSAGYGVLFGTVVGGNTGTTTTGTNLGPSSLTGSGKVTLWNSPGLYAISLDAVDHANVQTTAIVYPTTNSAAWDTPVPGAQLGVNATGLLCRYVSGPIVAQFVELTNSGGLVQTPGRFFSSSPSASTFDRVVIQWAGSGYRTIS